MTHKTSSAYLENSPSIPLHLPLARVFGVNAAIILQQIRYWMSLYQKAEQTQSADKRQHWHDDRWWVYNTYEQWQSDNFDFWSKSTIQRHINALENEGVLISAEFNKSSGDRTKWYTINFDVLDKLVGENEGAVNPSSQSDQTIYSNSVDHLVKVSSSIYKDTETTSETTTEEKTTGAKSAPDADAVETCSICGNPDAPHWLGYAYRCEDHEITAKYEEPPKRKRSAKQLALDGMKNALADAFGLNHDKVTGTKWNEFGTAGKELLMVGATPADMAPLHAWCVAKRWEDFSSMAMSKEYAKFDKARTQHAAPQASTTTSHDTRTALGLVD